MKDTETFVGRKQEPEEASTRQGLQWATRGRRRGTSSLTRKPLQLAGARLPVHPGSLREGFCRRKRNPGPAPGRRVEPPLNLCWLLSDPASPGSFCWGVPSSPMVPRNCALSVMLFTAWLHILMPMCFHARCWRWG